MELQINDPVIVTQRELAVHANDIQHLQADMDKLIVDMEEIKKAIHDIQKMLADQNASKRTMNHVWTVASGLLGGTIVLLIQKFWK